MKATHPNRSRIAVVGAPMYADGEFGRLDQRESPWLIEVRRGDMKPSPGDETLEAVKGEVAGRYQASDLGRARLDPAAVWRDDYDRRRPIDHAYSIVNPFRFGGGKIGVAVVEIRHRPPRLFFQGLHTDGALIVIEPPITADCKP